MAWEQRDNSGSLFKRKPEERKSERSSEYSGKAMIGGVEHYVDAWVKEDRNGKKYFSLSFKPINGAFRGSSPEPQRDYGRPMQPAPKYPSRSRDDDRGPPDDKIPF
jgi:hypothetical protein